ncbi:2-hydroxy-3-oxopropionate reductase [Aeromicrobium halocynthiae]|uniref:2-hydroxy-3-oxopropionate reductase n=1 Tax=Aeromicrobium halocynthiae TaxID=560557 RepID=A0ABN2VQU2_9ACTN
MRIGFVGLGVMGRPMATHLVQAGHEVVCTNRSRPAVDALVAAGATAADTPAEAAERVDVVITMLPDAPDVEAVVLGPDGIVETAQSGTLLIDCSTIAPHAAQDLGAALAGRGLRFVDAPVSGGEAGAVAGRLAIMLGGESDAVADATEALDAFAGVMSHVGPVGSGQLVKSANQMLVAGALAMTGEALTLLGRAGVDVEAAIGVLNGGLAGSKVLEVKAPTMLARDFTPGFRLDLHAKDLKIALAAAEQAGVAVPVTGVVTQLVQGLRAAGDGGDDHGALIKAIERLSAISAGGQDRTADEETA